MTNETKKHYRGIKVKYFGPTKHQGSRIRITDELFDQSRIIGFSYKYDNVPYQAIDYLAKNGFNIVGYSEMANDYMIFCDNWGDDCIQLEDIK
jgi:hypothetical protein